VSSDADKRKWDARYANAACANEPSVAAVLIDNAHLLPVSGTALDAACGLGANALFLARRGLEVSAWDLSSVAIERLAKTAARFGLNVDACVRDVIAAPPAPSSFHVIVVSRFLHRDLIPRLKSALRPGGLICYQTFITAKDPNVGPANPEYLLRRNELLRLFADFQCVVYREECSLGQVSCGLRNEAYIIAQKPSLQLLRYGW
jgi:SAM-dependent methyltransferase